MKFLKIASIVIVAALLSLLAICGHCQPNPADNSIPSRGGKLLVATNFSARPYQLQTDPAWGNDTVGGSGESLSRVGCTVCCVSMAFSQLGKPTDPKTLNSDLKQKNGFTSQGLLKWNVAELASKNTIVFDLPNKPSHVAIDTAIQAGHPVIAKVLLRELVPHWVLIVGKEGDEYLVKNPLCREQAIQRLSKLSTKIQSIRIAKRKS
jgi:hypothetical protein